MLAQNPDDLLLYSVLCRQVLCGTLIAGSLLLYVVGGPPHDGIRVDGRFKLFGVVAHYEACATTDHANSTIPRPATGASWNGNGAIMLPPSSGTRFRRPTSDATRRPSSWLDVEPQQVVHSVRAEEAEVASFSDSPENRMDIHKNARLTPHSRADSYDVSSKGTPRRPWPRPSGCA
jgi:hypothetical protein